MFTRHRLSVLVLLVAVLTPFPVAADTIDISLLDLVASSIVTSPRVPERSAADSQLAVNGGPARAETLLSADGLPFPNVPTSQTTAFSSVVSAADGFFAAGVNGFFPQASNLLSEAPYELLATGAINGSVKNNSDSAVSVDVSFFVPEPFLDFAGVTDVRSSDVFRGADASAEMRLSTSLIHTDGSIDFPTTLLDYGLKSEIDPATGILSAVSLGDSGNLSSFRNGRILGFRLPELNVTNLSLGNVGPGETRTFQYRYDAFASTQFQVGVRAGIGDPFNLSFSGGPFDFQVRDATGPITPASPVPEPGTLAMLGLGLVLLGRLARHQPKL